MDQQATKMPCGHSITYQASDALNGCVACELEAVSQSSRTAMMEVISALDVLVPDVGKAIEIAEEFLG